MGKEMINLGKQFFYYILMGAGVLVTVGAILDWKWITRISSPTKLGFIRNWIEEIYGIEGRYRFERFIIFICGIVLFIAGVVYWYFYN